MKVEAGTIPVWILERWADYKLSCDKIVAIFGCAVFFEPEVTHF
jgi:hypothetical protein